MTEPIKYREYKIMRKIDMFFFEHEEFTGAEDNRYGSCVSLSDAKSIIDNATIEEQEHTITILRKKIADLELLNSCNQKQIELHENFIRFRQ
jgi:hypothetical protein